MKEKLIEFWKQYQIRIIAGIALVLWLIIAVHSCQKPKPEPQIIKIIKWNKYDKPTQKKLNTLDSIRNTKYYRVESLESDSLQNELNRVFGER